MATRAEAPSGDKAWFLRALLVLQSPRSVFAALRDDSDDAAEDRQDVAGALVWLAGISGILATTVASTLLDDLVIDGALAAVWAFLAGGLYGFFLYYVVGKISHVALRKLGSRGSFRRARHVLAVGGTPELDSPGEKRSAPARPHIKRALRIPHPAQAHGHHAGRRQRHEMAGYNHPGVAIGAAVAFRRRAVDDGDPIST